MDEFSDVFIVQRIRTGLKMNTKKNKLLRLGINENEEIILGI